MPLNNGPVTGSSHLGLRGGLFEYLFFDEEKFIQGNPAKNHIDIFDESIRQHI